MDVLLRESKFLKLRCFDLVPASEGDRVVGFWRGRRSDIPERFSKAVRAFKCRKHFLSVDQHLFDDLGLQGCGPLALSMFIMPDDNEQLAYVNVLTGDLSQVAFEDSIPLTAQAATSLPPIEALILYGGASI